MVTLKGILYQSGHIDFPQGDNRWAFKRMAAELKSGQEDRILVKPDLAPIEIERSPNVPAEEVPWLQRTAALINTADLVYFQLKRQVLRFRRAIHEMEEHCQLVTLASQEEVNYFAKKFWGRVAYLYATRHDGFRFNVGTLISLKNPEKERPNRVELISRLVPGEDNQLPHIEFDATGSHAPPQLVEWRSSVKEGESGRLLFPETQIQLVVTLAKQPLIFCHEFRAEFDNHAYIFSGEKLDKRLKRALKRERSTTD